LQGVAKTLMHEPQIIDIGMVREAHRDIHHQVILADKPDHKDKLLVALLQQGGFKRALIFSNKRDTAHRLMGFLRYHKLRCATLHGEMSTEDRREVITQFADGKIDIVSASDLAARGLDIKDIDLVVNYDLPRSGDDYIHRTGRTGRAGAKGLAVSLVSAPDWNLMVSIERYAKLSFERRGIPGLKAKFSGPKKTKASGKAAGSKKKRSDSPKGKSKSRKKNQQSQGKPRSKNIDQKNDGFAPPKKKITE
jgi:ATP-dependent RNA helicase SrmB